MKKPLYKRMDYWALCLTALLLYMFLCSVCFGQWSGVKPMLGKQINWAHPLSKGLVGLWLFNEGSGNTAADLSGNGNTGTLQGSASWVSGKYGSAIDLPGANPDYITILNSPSIEFSGDMTVVFLVKSDIYPQQDRLLSKRDSGGHQFEVIVAANDKFQFEDGTNNRKSVSGVFTSANIWYHVAVVVNNGILTFYLDSVSQALDGTGVNVTANDAPLIVGNFGTTFAEPWNGQFDHIIYYNRALSASEIALLYREPFCMFQKDNTALIASVEAPPAGGGQLIIIQMSAISIIALSLIFIKRINCE